MIASDASDRMVSHSEHPQFISVTDMSSKNEHPFTTNEYKI